MTRGSATVLTMAAQRFWLRGRVEAVVGGEVGVEVMGAGDFGVEDSVVDAVDDLGQDFDGVVGHESDEVLGAADEEVGVGEAAGLGVVPA